MTDLSLRLELQQERPDEDVRNPRIPYKVCGNKKVGYAVVGNNGVVEYDLIETKDVANRIRNVLNSGYGPEWEAIEIFVLAGGTSGNTR